MRNINIINYTIIIPHKNIPTLLERCLCSIPLRDDIQVIVVDDNSDPSIVDFNNFPGLKRSDTEVYFTKEGKGAGYARNIGLSKAKGKWLIFADSDDFFNDCFNELLDIYKDISADIVLFQSNSLNSETLEENNSRGNSYNKWIKKSFNNNIILEELRFKYHPPWGKFISTKLVVDNQIKFDEVFSSNDVMFSTLTGYYAKRILIDLKYLYCSTYRNGSLNYTTTKQSILPRFSVAISHYKFLLSKNKVKYRINIWDYIFTLRKLDKNWIRNYVLYSVKEMRFYHLIHDLFRFINRQIKK
jgi:glycosyltransferase involved in cell wall biosynthesis